MEAFLQSSEEWQTRNRVLARSLAELLDAFMPATGEERALDVGCQDGALTRILADHVDLQWWGVDPVIEEPMKLSQRIELLPGSAHALPFRHDFFRCAVFANVYEHVIPDRRGESLAELRRVLFPGGIVVGQLPNPYFPIESHSRLPFMGWLPTRLQRVYYQLSPVPWEHDFFVVTIRDLLRRAERAGFETLYRKRFNYPLEVIPEKLRLAARLLERPMRYIPWAWQFVLRRPNGP
jgi:SAM-dependent methyltransferase